MAPYLGDIVEDATLRFIWSTNDSDGASITRATDGTVSVYKDLGTTQTVAGVYDTYEDFDGLTGVHGCRIDTSADAFYATGSDYTVVLSAATIDSQTVNAVLAHFSIENRSGLRPTTAGRTLDVTSNGEAGLDLDNTSGTIAAAQIASNAITAAKIADNAIAAAKIATDAITAAKIAADAIGSSELASTAVNEIVDQVWDEAQSGHTTGGSFGEVATEVAAVLVDTAEIGAAGAGLTAVSRAIYPQKNQPLNNIEVLMVDSADGRTPKTGVSPTVTKSIDGAAFSSTSGTVSQVANGIYQFDATASDMNGDIITFRFAGSGADDTFLTLKTTA